jgi:hypothetical protein
MTRTYWKPVRFGKPFTIYEAIPEDIDHVGLCTQTRDEYFLGMKERT